MIVYTDLAPDAAGRLGTGISRSLNWSRANKAFLPLFLLTSEKNNCLSVLSSLHPTNYIVHFILHRSYLIASSLTSVGLLFILYLTLTFATSTSRP